MMKKYKVIIALFVVLGFSIQSCDEFLEAEVPPHLVDSQTFGSDPLYAEQLLFGMYKLMLNSWSMAGGRQIENTLTDVSWGQGASNRNSNSIFIYSSADNVYWNWWTASYDIIAQANVAIRFIDELVEDEDLKVQLVAEAKASRAWAYFALYRQFGLVPVSTIAVTDINSPEAEEQLKLKKATQEEFSSYIIADLTEAIEGLPEEGALTEGFQKGRWTKDAARFVLAKYHWYVASLIERPIEPVTDDPMSANEHWTETISLCNEILGTDPINPPRWALMDFYPKIFHHGWEDENTEVMMVARQEFGQADPVIFDNLANVGMHNIRQAGYVDVGWTNAGTFQGKPVAYNLFEFSDSTRMRWNYTRVNHSNGGITPFGNIAEFYSADYPNYWNGRRGPVDPADSMQVAEYRFGLTGTYGQGNDRERMEPTKFRRYPYFVGSDYILNDPDTDVPKFRLGEVYLLIAEAINELHDDPSATDANGWNAFDYVNVIRARARNHATTDMLGSLTQNVELVPGVNDVADWAPGFYGYTSTFDASLLEVGDFSSGVRLDPIFSNQFRRDVVQSDLDNPIRGYSSDYEAFHWEILNERHRELNLEDFSRMGDLRRRGVIQEYVGNANNGKDLWMPGRNNRNGTDNVEIPKHLLYPIPLNAIQANSRLKQNPGY